MTETNHYEKWAKHLVELSRRIHLLQASTIIVAGAGSKNMLIGIRTAWEQNPETKGKKFPQVCSLGQIEKSTRNMNNYEVQDIIQRQLGKNLEKARKGRAYVIDECLHRGDTVDVIQRALLDLGFKSPRFGVLMAHDVKANQKIINGREFNLDYVAQIGGACPVFKGRRTLFLPAIAFRELKTALKKDLPGHEEALTEPYQLTSESYRLARSKTLQVLKKNREITRQAVKNQFKRKPIILPK